MPEINIPGCRVTRITHATTSTIFDENGHTLSDSSNGEMLAHDEEARAARAVYSVCQDSYRIYFTTQDPDYPDEYPYNQERLDRFVKQCYDNDRVCLSSLEFLTPCDFDYNCEDRERVDVG